MLIFIVGTVYQLFLTCQSLNFSRIVTNGVFVDDIVLIQGSKEVNLVFIAVPSAVNKILPIKDQHLVHNVLNIIPTIGDIEGQKLTVHVSSHVVTDSNLVGGKRSVHCGHSLSAFYTLSSPSVVVTPFHSIRAVVADSVLRLDTDSPLTPFTLLGDIGALALVVEVPHLRLIHTSPGSEVVVVVGSHCGNSIDQMTAESSLPHTFLQLFSFNDKAI